jgi:DDE family transposase
VLTGRSPQKRAPQRLAGSKEKIAKLKEELKRFHGLKTRMLAAPDQQKSTDPDSRSMATSGRGSGVVGYNVQVAVDTANHLIITHEVTNVGSDRAHLARMAKQSKATLAATSLDVIADRGYFSGEEILECDKDGRQCPLGLDRSDAKRGDADSVLGKAFRVLGHAEFFEPLRKVPHCTAPSAMVYIRISD